MGKGSRGGSSASAATRKKHAKKHAPPPEEPVPKTKKGKKERGKKEPRQKIYIPPVKPAPVQPDPLETTGLAHSLPAELLIVLRSFNKKAEVTKIRALEELQSGWVDKCSGDEVMEYTVVEMLPVWLHHVSALFLHPSRRVRALTASLHLSLLQIPPVKEHIFFFLRETASTSQAESILGSWCVAANDIDKTVATTAMKSWKEAVGTEEGQFELDPSSQAALVEFVQRTALDPIGIYAYLNPVQPSITPVHSHPSSRKGSGRNTPAVQPRKENPEQLLRNKMEEVEESDQDRKARLRFGALGAIRWILESLETIPEALLPLFGNPAFLTALQPNASVPWLDGLESFGYGQPAVRKNMWSLMLVLLSKRKGMLQDVSEELSRAILRSAFIETDSNVQSAMWYPLLLFLKEFPNAWELEVKASQEDFENENEDSDDESETKPTPSAAASVAYREFLQFLQLGCSGSPVQGYTTVVVILSTISSPIIASSSTTPLDDLFSSFWAALDGRALSSLNRTTSAAAFLSSLLECMLLVVKRVQSSSSTPEILSKLVGAEEDEVDAGAYAKKLVKEQVGRVWKEVEDGKLKIFERDLAKSVMKTLQALEEVDGDLCNTAWETLSGLIFDSALAHSKLAARFVKALQAEAQQSEEWTEKLSSVVAQLADKSLEGYATPTSDEGKKQQDQLLADLLDTFQQHLFVVSASFRERLDEMLVNKAYELLRESTAVLLSSLAYRGQDAGGDGKEVSKKVWSSILVRLAEEEEEGMRDRWLKVLVDAAQGGRLPVVLKIYAEGQEAGVLDEIVGKSLLGPRDGGRVDVMKGILVHHDYFISKPAFKGIFESLCASLKSEITAAFVDPFFAEGEGSKSQNGSSIHWAVYETLLELVLATYGVVLRSQPVTSPVDDLAADAFLFAYLLPFCEEIGDEQGNSQGKRAFELAGELWTKWFENAVDLSKEAESGKSKASMGLRDVRRRLKGLIVGTKSRVLPQTVLRLLLTPPPQGSSTGPSFFRDHPEFRSQSVMHFLPTASELDAMLSQLLPGMGAEASMGVLEPLVPPPTAYPYSALVRITSSYALDASEDELAGVDRSGYDRHGYSAYARAVSALVSIFAKDRAIAKSREGVEILRHLGVIEVCAWDGICVPATLGTAASVGQKVFGDRVPVSEGEGDVLGLAELITRVEQVTTYVLLAAGGRAPWKRYVLDSLPGSGAKGASATGAGDEVGGVSKSAHAAKNALSSFVLDTIGRSVQSEMDLKAGVAVTAGSLKDQVNASRNSVVLVSRVLRRVLERFFDDADSDDQEGVGLGKEEVDIWVAYARKVEKAAPLTSATVLATLTAIGVDSPKLDRARNEFAASLLGVTPANANIEGLALLRALGGCVPYEDVDDAVGQFETRLTATGSGLSMKTRGARRGGSDVIMLPVQRAVNVVRACQLWVEGQPPAGGSDEDDSEEEDDGPSEDLEGAMLAVFIGLAPILQNVPGKHWDFMWDVAETVLEHATLQEEGSLVGLSYALRFVRVMEDLVRTNKQLKAEWAKRRVPILSNVRDLLLEEDGDDGNQKLNSVPRSVCRELVLSIVQSLPGELIDKDTLGKMCHLVTDPSIEVQKLGYGMLRQAAGKRTEWIVIEVGVGSLGAAEGEGEPEPVGLATSGVTEEAPGSTPVEAPSPAPATPVEGKKIGRRKDGRLRRKKPKVVKDEGPSLLPQELIGILQRDEEADVLGWMLGWMLIFDLFKDASFKVKSMYIEQLRNLDLVGSRLLPFIIHTLRLDEGLTKAVKVELWAVEEFYVPYYEPLSAPALAAHLYYRALLSVPSLIYAWVLACKDRQLSNAITTMTSQHFSPLIIRAEVAHLKSPEGIAELTGEGVSVKVVGGNSEVVAAYAVDEHQLEIKLKIPPDWPLHHIEVRDEKRVGVDENRWRAWVLGVQQTIWTHNGRIVDGLSLWKKNVTLHFEGQVECAICYSIISASDGSLPKKPCKTCRNRFHAGCLYKWFNTSHSSSCPLCRSNII